MKWHIIWAIARKDILDAIKNWYILFAIILPIGLSLLFGLLSSSGTEDLVFNVGVYDPSNSTLTGRLESLPNVHVSKASSPEQIEQMVAKDAIGGLIIPDGFDAQIAAGKQPELAVYLNGQAGGGGLTAFRRLIEDQVWELVGQAAPVRVVFHDVSSQESKGSGSSSPFLALLLVMALAMVGVFVVPTFLVEEKERRTLLALQVSPASTTDVVIGKSLVGLFYSLFTTLILLTLNQGWQGQWPLTLLALALGALFVILVGLLMGSLFNTTGQVNTWSSVVMLVLMVPSWVVMLPLPAGMDIAFRFIPTYYLSQLITAAVDSQAAWNQVGLPISVMAVSAMVTFALVVWRMQRENVR